MSDLNALGSRDIRQLLAVADHGSIRRAAEMLGMTQPGLSKNIRLIEERLGASLFERSTAGAQPTVAGSILLSRGRQVLLDLAALQRDLVDSIRGDTALVRLGFGPVIAPVLANRMVSRMRAAHPGIVVELKVLEPARLVEEVESGACDFAICSIEERALPASLANRRLRTFEGSIVARREHPLAGNGAVPPEALASCRFAIPHPYPRMIDWFCQFTGAERLETGFLCADFDLIAEVVQHSDLLSITWDAHLIRLQQKYDLIALPVSGLRFDHEVHLVQSRSRPLSLAATRVLKEAEEALASAPELDTGALCAVRLDRPV